MWKKYPLFVFGLLFLAACSSQAITENLNSFILKENLPAGISFDDMEEPANIPGEKNQFYVTADYSNEAVGVSIKRFETTEMARGQIIIKNQRRDPEDTVETITSSGHNMDIVRASNSAKCSFYIEEYEFQLRNSGNQYEKTDPVDNGAFREFCIMMFNNAISILGEFQAQSEDVGKTYSGIGSFTVTSGDKLQIDDRYHILVESNDNQATPDYVLFDNNVEILRSSADQPQFLYSPENVPYTIFVYRVVQADSNLRVYQDITPAQSFELSENQGFACANSYIFFDYQQGSTLKCWVNQYKDPTSAQLDANAFSEGEIYSCGQFDVKAVSCDNQKVLFETIN